MKFSSFYISLIIVSFLATGLSKAESQNLVETLYFKDQIDAKTLPSIEERLPKDSHVVSFDDSQTIGQSGGVLKTLMPRQKDIRLLLVYGYARLVGYTKDYELKPDLLKDIDVEDERKFTLTLREGHKWSDGHAFTTEDFRYYWEDVANNTSLFPTGPPSFFYVDGELPKVEILNEHQIRYVWEKPNPFFLHALAKPYPLFIYKPAHYLKQFHEKYAEADKLAKLVEEKGQRNWAALHNKLDNQHRYDNPDLPMLQPWINTTTLPSKRFVFKRNPFYHRVDSKGQQLPYLDEIHVEIVNKKLIPTKSGVGETDLQARGIKFSDFTFLKKNENQYDYKVFLWPTGQASRIALYPNLNVEDENWQKIVRDVRFRRALSLSIDRKEINEVIYYGLAREGNNTVLPQSPLYKEYYQNQWANLDIDQANKLLDEAGLDKKDEDGFRLLPNGKIAEIIIETAGEDSEQVDVLQIIKDHWEKVGLKLFVKPSQRDVFRTRIFSGETLMSVWLGHDNGIPTAGMSPVDYCPVRQDHLQWPKWGQYFETKTKAGHEVDIPEAKNLLDLYKKWQFSKNENEKRQIWHDILTINTDQVFSIGVVSGIRQPIIVKNFLKNVPEKGLYNWNPGSHFGIYRPDTFWIDKTR